MHKNNELLILLMGYNIFCFATYHIRKNEYAYPYYTFAGKETTRHTRCA